MFQIVVVFRSDFSYVHQAEIASRDEFGTPQSRRHQHKMHTVALLLLVAVLGATAFTPPRLFGPPRTRAQALAYAKKAVYKDADKDSVAATPVAPLKGSRQRRVEMMIDPACVPGARALSLTERCALARPHRSVLRAGSVIVPDWFLPVAAASALTLPVMIAFTFGDMDTDKFRRERNGGVTLEQRAVGDFQRGLTRALQRVGVLAKPPPTTARSELGCDPHPRPRSRPRSAPSSVSHPRTCSVAG